jgi:exodeoxyribonuclease VII large subunit
MNASRSLFEDPGATEERAALAKERGAGSPVLSVSILVRSARDLLERGLPVSWVAGEVSNFSRAASGHWYFSLKDSAAQVDCVMFRNRVMLLDWTPKEGQRVEARARVTLYEPRGRFQLNVEALRPGGLGALYERFLELRARLDAEGLFAPESKRPIPVFPRRVGVVTSLAAAALRDVLSTLARRDPSIDVLVYPTAVQGQGAAAEIAGALRRASARGECEVLLLVRGGGSIEDLWAFNEEPVARAIRASAVPVISGVGHETDVTIADLTADARAATPTAAAEAVSTSREDLLQRLVELVGRLSRETDRRLEYGAQTLDSLARRLIHPAARLSAHRALLTQWLARLSAAAARRLGEATEALRDGPQRIAVAMRRRLDADRARLARLEVALTALDPSAVLARGYSITRDVEGRILADATGVRAGDLISTMLSHGEIRSTVRDASSRRDTG